MAHPRKLIRHAVVALLKSASTAAADRVLPTRVEAWKKGTLPVISVYTLTDELIEASTSHTEDMHELHLEIAGWVAHTDSDPCDDRMDDLAEQIEAAMLSNQFLSGTAVEVDFRGTELEVAAVDGRSDPTVGIAVLAYSVRYRSSKTPPATLDDFLTANATTELVGGLEDDTVPVADTFTVQEIP